MIDPATAPASVQEARNVITPIDLFRTMANAETLYPAYIKYISLLFKPTELDSVLERMIVLHVAKQSDCFYAWRQNVVVAKSLKVSQKQIDAIEIGDTSASCFSPAQKAAFRFTDECMQLIEVTDPTYEQTKGYFSDRAITEMLYVIGTYMLVVRMLRTGRIALDEKVPMPRPTSTGQERSMTPTPESQPTKVSMIATFSKHSFLENLAVRSDNSLIVTVANRRELWYVPPVKNDEPVTPILIDAPDEATTGIVEVEPDVFCVSTSRNLDKSSGSYLLRYDFRDWQPGDPNLSPKMIFDFGYSARELNGQLSE